MERNPESPWNPAEPVKVTPAEYERQALAWLESADSSLSDFRVGHRKLVEGEGGDYEIDVVAEFTVFQGAQFRVLVECKRHRRPVERDDVLAFAMKVHDTRSQKGILFSTAGFQSGALEFAAKRGLAMVTFLDGMATYETKSRSSEAEPPPWIHLPAFAGYVLSWEEGKIRSNLIDETHNSALGEWLEGERSDQP